MKYFLLSIAVLLSGFSFGQSCCSDPNLAFANLGSKSGFRSEHELPRPLTEKPTMGKMIHFTTNDGIDGSGYFIKAKEETNNWLIVVHEWWGLNDHIKLEAEKLWKDIGNVNVIAVDLYDGEVATTRENAARLMQSAQHDRIVEILKGAVRYAGMNARIGSIGWCYGGGWSLQTAIIAEGNGQACVMYYGMPERDPIKLAKLHTDVLAIGALKDTWITPRILSDFEKNMATAGESVTVKEYEADHAFANPSSPRYNEEAAQNAYIEALAYLKKKFK